VARFAVGNIPPHGEGFVQYLEDPSHWRPERAALHERLLENALRDAREFADQLAGEQPTLFAMRGNTAAGKTRAVAGNVEELAATMRATKELRYRAVNPDAFKPALMRETPGATSQDVHWESSALANRLEKQLLATRVAGGRPASMLIDRRLLRVKDVVGYIELAQQSGRRFVLFDVDASLEDSLVGVLEREPGGTDPLTSFQTVADGFQSVREQRDAVRMLFKDARAGEYHLYSATPTGERIEIAFMKDGELTIKEPALYDRAMLRPETELDRVRITRDAIDALTRNLDPERAAKVRAILEKYEGWTWKSALDAHSREKPSQ
jgi:hypothetical protein